MTTSKTLFFALGALALGLLAWALDPRSRAPSHPRHEPPQRRLVSAPGRIEGVGEQSRLRFSVNGRVREVAVAEGQYVQAGTTLLRIDHEQSLRELERAQAELRAAESRLRLLLDGTRQHARNEAQALYDAQRAELAQVETAFQRVRELRFGEVATQQEFEHKRSELQVMLAKVAAARSHLELLQAPPRAEEVQVAQAQVDAARANLELAQLALSQTRLTAPVAGQVLRVGVRLGELTGPHSVEAAVVLADTRRLCARAFVDEIDASRIAVGMNSRVTIDGLSGQVVRGRVIRVSPAIGPKRLWTGEPGERFDSDVQEIWLEIEQHQNLIVGLRAQVLIDTRTPNPSTEVETSRAPTATAVRPPPNGAAQR